MALEKLTSESSKTEAELWAQVVVVEEALDVERARVKCPECDVAAEDVKRQQLLADCRETSETASRQLAKDGESLQESRSKVATLAAELRKLRKLAAETAEEMKVAKDGVVVQLELLEAAREEVDTQSAEIAELREQLAATNAELLQLSSKHGSRTTGYVL